MKLKLASSISSPQDLQALISEIRNYARWYGHNAIKLRLHAKTKRHGGQAEPELSPAAKEVLAGWGKHDELTRRELDSLINELERFARTAQEITITLAAPASNSIKQILVAWCRDNIAPDILVNFQFNATILGGLVVRYRSRIFDWSFRRQILEARGQFPEVLRHV